MKTRNQIPLFGSFFMLFSLSQALLLPFYTQKDSDIYKNMSHTRIVQNTSDKERILLDDIIPIDFKKYGLNKTLTPLERKYKLVKIAATILKKAKKRGVDIKKVSIGSRLLHVFKNPNLTKELSKYLNDGHVNKKLKTLKKKLKAERKTRQKAKTAKPVVPQTPIANQSAQDPRLAQSMFSQMQPQALMPYPGAFPSFDPRQLNIPYTSGLGGPLGGMPPMMLNSVNMHGPMNVVVNRLNDPNIRPSLNPLEIEHNNLEEQYSGLEKLEHKLSRINDDIGDINKDIEMEVEDKYSKMMQLSD